MTPAPIYEELARSPKHRAAADHMEQARPSPFAKVNRILAGARSMFRSPTDSTPTEVNLTMPNLQQLAIQTATDSGWRITSPGDQERWREERLGRTPAEGEGHHTYAWLFTDDSARLLCVQFDEKGERIISGIAWLRTDGYTGIDAWNPRDLPTNPQLVASPCWAYSQRNPSGVEAKPELVVQQLMDLLQRPDAWGEHQVPPVEYGPPEDRAFGSVRDLEVPAVDSTPVADGEVVEKKTFAELKFVEPPQMWNREELYAYATHFGWELTAGGSVTILSRGNHKLILGVSRRSRVPIDREDIVNSFDLHNIRTDQRVVKGEVGIWLSFGWDLFRVLEDPAHVEARGMSRDPASASSRRRRPFVNRSAPKPGEPVVNAETGKFELQEPQMEIGAAAAAAILHADIPDGPVMVAREEADGTLRVEEVGTEPKLETRSFPKDFRLPEDFTRAAQASAGRVWLNSTTAEQRKPLTEERLAELERQPLDQPLPITAEEFQELVAGYRRYLAHQRARRAFRGLDADSSVRRAAAEIKTLVDRGELMPDLTSGAEPYSMGGYLDAVQRQRADDGPDPAPVATGAVPVGDGNFRHPDVEPGSDPGALPLGRVLTAPPGLKAVVTNLSSAASGRTTPDQRPYEVTVLVDEIEAVPDLNTAVSAFSDLFIDGAHPVARAQMGFEVVTGRVSFNYDTLTKRLKAIVEDTKRVPVDYEPPQVSIGTVTSGLIDSEVTSQDEPGADEQIHKAFESGYRLGLRHGDEVRQARRSL